MKKDSKDINDDEIRIILSSDNRKMPGKNNHRNIIVWVLTALIIIGVCLWTLVKCDSQDGEESETESIISDGESSVSDTGIEPAFILTTASVAKGFTSVRDTIVNGTELMILTPVNGRPSLAIGGQALDDPDIVLAVQAADIRKDNGQIVGAFVLDGELLSKGESKAGFCAIINGVMTIGIADATPMLEQVLTSGGYFFRQFPLVVGGQIVENKSHRKATRRALAEIDGKICVVVSKQRLSFHDFSQALIDAGAQNAIYLVGSISPGIYRTKNGEVINLGTRPESFGENVNFLVWK